MVSEHAVDAWRGIGRWVDAVADLHGRIAYRFARAEVRERARRYLVGLHTLNDAELEHLVIHGDATNDNLIVAGTPPRTVGLIDFGSAHVAPWICDLAAALWRSGRPDPNAVAYDPERLRRFVVGYHRVSPLPSELACAIPLLMEGRGIQLISRRVRRLPQAPAGPPVPAVLDALVRTEWLHAHRAEFVDVIAGSLGGTQLSGERDA
jgi:Ser/Thr protein kinase RdoA (MazF antagonist)